MKYIIEIPKPCNENWSKMTPTDKGMYCSNCKKEVIDFTNFSKYELAKRISKNDKVCGKFLASQVNTELDYSKANFIQKTGIIFGFSSLLLTSQAFSQVTKPDIEIVEKDSIEKTISENNYIEIRGNVTDGTLPLPGANVFEINTKNSVQTDVDGNFIINIPIENFKQNVFLKFKFLGMKEIEKQVFKNQQKLDIQLPINDELMGEVVIFKRQNIFKRIGNWFRR